MHTNRRSSLIATVVAAVVAFTACGASSDVGAGEPSTSLTSTTPEASVVMTVPVTVTTVSEPVPATTVTESYAWDDNVAIPIPIPADLQSHASSVALSDPAVLALTGSRRISVVQVSAYGGTLWAQVYVKLDDGEATLTGDWPHVVFENNTDRRQGRLRYHFEPGTGTRTVNGLLVNVDTDTWTVKEILSDPPIDPAPPPATTTVGQP